ncbi:MAG: hypothetical protein QM538_00620 [Methylacidiphilales bacterium]|nr:hypothetical protein [Candidatus Methylacidiphilales bacterium]
MPTKNYFSILQLDIRCDLDRKTLDSHLITLLDSTQNNKEEILEAYSVLKDKYERYKHIVFLLNPNTDMSMEKHSVSVVLQASQWYEELENVSNKNALAQLIEKYEFIHDECYEKIKQNNFSEDCVNYLVKLNYLRRFLQYSKEKFLIASSQ